MDLGGAGLGPAGAQADVGEDVAEKEGVRGGTMGSPTLGRVVGLDHEREDTLGPVSARLVLVSVAVTALVLLASWLLRWPLEKAALLAPVIVVFVAVALGVFVFWGRVAWDGLRASRHPRWIVAGALSLVALVAVLTLLGVQLPRE
jgi:hypothetical protein